mgnify:CR=1 FL=1
MINSELGHCKTVKAFNKSIREQQEEAHGDLRDALDPRGGVPLEPRGDDGRAAGVLICLHVLVTRPRAPSLPSPRGWRSRRLALTLRGRGALLAP